MSALNVGLITKHQDFNKEMHHIVLYRNFHLLEVINEFVYV